MIASIILATYCPTVDRARLVERSFGELPQTGVSREDYEIIVVNNGGLHEAMIEDLSPDITIRTSYNLGQASGLNIGASIARSKNLVFVDDDLSYKPGWLKVGIQMVNKFPRNVISLRAYGQQFATERTPKGHYISRKAGGCWLMRASLFWKLGRFSNRHYDFGGLWTRQLLRSGSRFVISKTPFMEHLGADLSIIGNNKEFIRSYRRAHE